VIVIDDLHELRSDQALAQLDQLLTQLPPSAHVVLATRRDPQLRLHQLRLAGEVTEIRADDLRFDEDDTRELLRASGVPLSQASVAKLHRRTEGWAAGLRLAAISLAGHPDPEGFVDSFSGNNRAVAEYLLAEMLERQLEDVQRLLLRTSILDRVNGELADLLTGSTGSEQILLELEDANAFVVSLNPERTWFRYHQLFAELLRLELRRTKPAEVPGLHGVAAGWLAEHGGVVEAIRHTQATGDWPAAARLLADRSFSLTLDGQADTIDSLLQAFPPGDSANDPELALVYATTDVLHGRFDEAAAHLALAESHLETTSAERRRRLRVATAAMRLSIARRRGRFGAVMEQMDFLAEPMDAATNADVALGSDLRAVALMDLGIVEMWSSKLADGERHLEQGARLARDIGRPFLEVGCRAQLGFASKHRSFAVARTRAQEAIALAQRHGWDGEAIIAPAMVSLGGTLVWMGEFDEGDRWLERAATITRAEADPATGLLLHLAAGMLHAGRGQHPAALEEFLVAERMQSQLVGEHALSAQVSGWAIATMARLGRIGDGRAALADLPAARAQRGEVANATAVLCLAEGDAQAALDAVAPVFEGSAPVIHDFTVVEAHLLAAVAYGALEDQGAAHAAVEQALALAEPDRLMLPFAMVAPWELLKSLPRHETAHAALLVDILDGVDGAAFGKRAQDNGLPAPELSPAELRVLRFLPTNLSRAEIANELFVSTNTINTHVRRIYAKLGAGDRSTAVQRAREQRLLSTGAHR
jgi:LuxR family maltose regulon positive regulatory protein